MRFQKLFLFRDQISSQHAWKASEVTPCLLAIQIQIQAVWVGIWYSMPSIHCSGRFIYIYEEIRQANPLLSNKFSLIFPSFLYLSSTKLMSKWPRAPGQLSEGHWIRIWVNLIFFLARDLAKALNMLFSGIYPKFSSFSTF